MAASLPPGTAGWGSSCSGATHGWSPASLDTRSLVEELPALAMMVASARPWPHLTRQQQTSSSLPANTPCLHSQVFLAGVCRCIPGTPRDHGPSASRRGQMPGLLVVAWNLPLAWPDTAFEDAA